MKVFDYILNKIFKVSPLLRRLYYTLRGDAYSYGKVPLNKAIGIAFDKFMPQSSYTNDKEQITKDIVRCYVLYGITPSDYFLFGFNTINTKHRQRKTFVSDELKDRTLINKEGWNNYLELSDKYAFYEKAKAFYGRKLFAFDEKTDKESFSQFVVSVKDLFIKPNGGVVWTRRICCALQ